MKSPNNTTNKQIDITIPELKIFGVPDLEPEPEPEPEFELLDGVDVVGMMVVDDGDDVVGLAVGHRLFIVLQ